MEASETRYPFYTNRQMFLRIIRGFKYGGDIAFGQKLREHLDTLPGSGMNDTVSYPATWLEMEAIGREIDRINCYDSNSDGGTSMDAAEALKGLLGDVIDKRAELQTTANESRDPMDRLKFEIYDHVVYRTRTELGHYFSAMFPERKAELRELAIKYRSRHHPDFTG